MSRFAVLALESQMSWSEEMANQPDPTNQEVEDNEDNEGFQVVVSRKTRQRERKRNALTPFDIWVNGYREELETRAQTDPKAQVILNLWEHFNWRGVYNFCTPVESKPMKDLKMSDLWARQFNGWAESGVLELSAYHELYSSLFLRDTKRGDNMMRRNMFNYRADKGGFITDYHTLCYGYDKFVSYIVYAPPHEVKTLRAVVEDIEATFARAVFDTLEATEEMYENTMPVEICEAFFKAVSKMVGHTIIPTVGGVATTQA